MADEIARVDITGLEITDQKMTDMNTTDRHNGRKMVHWNLQD